MVVSLSVAMASGVDVVVKIDKYAAAPDDCDAAVTNIEVMRAYILFICGEAGRSMLQ